MSELWLEAGSASISVDPVNGGRLSSLVVAGHQLLVIEGSLGPLQWGSYPMVPWAGRVRSGKFRFGGITHQLDCNLPPHAIHGVGFVSPWEKVDARTIALDMTGLWPFGGRVTQRFDLTGRDLTITVAVDAEVDMPIMIGWHPWFKRFLVDPADEGGSVEAELRFGPAEMYELDGSAIPTGRLVPAPEGPLDNCFTALERDPVISWPGLVDLALSSSCDHWVVFTEPERALCVEPQTAAPDVFNRRPPVLGAGDRLEAWFRLRWAH